MTDVLTTVSGERMLDYYPQVIRQILEFQALTKGEGVEIDSLKNDIELGVNEAYLTTMGEERIAQWEKMLGIAHSEEDTLQDRRDVIVARVRGQGKLNTSLINAIVGAFTGGTANSYIKDSVLHIEVTPPPDNKQYKFENVVKELSKKIPAHLDISVVRNYATWEEVNENFTDWNSIYKLGTWEDLLLYVTS